MSTVAEILARSAEFLAAAGIETPRLDAEVLLARALDVSRSGLFARLRDPLDPEPAARFESLVERRLRREPVAYIVGGREFWSLWFAVTPDTLIPRPETEGLVEITLAAVANTARPSILDVGTGSGCIAISLAIERPDAAITAIDTGEAALAVARGNAERLGVAERIDFVRADLRDFTADRRFDLIVANPPYVKRGDIDALQPDVARFEPRAALDGGDDGLDLVRALLLRSGNLLRPGSTIAIEIGADQRDLALAAARGASLEQGDVREDRAGLPRILVARKPSGDSLFPSPPSSAPSPQP